LKVGWPPVANKKVVEFILELRLSASSFRKGKNMSSAAKLKSTEMDGSEDVGGVAGKRLLSFFERIERLEEEKAALAEDIKEVYAEAKSAGFEVKIMRRVMKLRKMDIEKRQEEDELLSLYMSAIGMA